MTHRIKTAILSTAIAATSIFAPAALAQDVPVPRIKPSPYLELTLAEADSPLIGIARISEGRLTAAPTEELRDWADMSLRIDDDIAEFLPVSPVALDRIKPAEAYSANKIDEIRLAAADQGMAYVIIYGTGRDAMWNSFGRQKLDDTGLYVPAGHALSAKGKVKALIVGTYSGTIYGTVTSNDTSEGLTDFTRRVEEVITALPTRNVPENLI